MNTTLSNALQMPSKYRFSPKAAAPWAMASSSGVEADPGSDRLTKVMAKLGRRA